MTSSKWFELRIRDGEGEQALELSGHDVPGKALFERPVHTRRQSWITIERGGYEGWVWVLLGSDIVVTLPAERERQEADLRLHLRNHCGEALLRVEVARDRTPDDRQVAFEIALPLTAPLEIEALYGAILEDLNEVHLGLVTDVVGRQRHAVGGPTRARTYDHEEEFRFLEAAYDDFAVALKRIGVNPSQQLDRRRIMSQWRAGDPFEVASVQELFRDPATEWDGAQLRKPGRMALMRNRLSTDLPEHRHLRHGLMGLARRAEQLERASLKSAAMLRDKAKEWSGARRDGPSVYERRDLPRALRFDTLAQASRDLAQRFRRLVRKHEFLRRAPRPQAVLQPTPLFLGQRGYREAYRALRSIARRQRDALDVDTGTIQMQLRSLDVLFEYWTFVKCVMLCTEILGPPESGHGFQLDGSVVFMELRAGQKFVWRRGDREFVELHYEPAFPPTWQDLDGPYGWRAAMAQGALRPDVLLVVQHRRGRDDVVQSALALDAKNSPSFDKKRMFQISDYRTLIHHPETGHQPVRQLFLVHRDPTMPQACSMPGYLSGGLRPPRSASIVGAISLGPGQDQNLRRVLKRFLALYGIRRPLRANGR